MTYKSHTKMKNKISYKILGISASAVCLGMCFPVSIHAENFEKKIVRVAFPVQKSISEYNKDGSPTGYNFDYLEKLSEFTDWDIEYIKYEDEDENQALYDAFTDLQDGKVDLLGPLLRNDSTEDEFEYPELSYGTVYTTLCSLNTGNLREDNLNLKTPLRVGLLEKADISNAEVVKFLDSENIDYELSYYESDEKRYEALKDEKVDVISGVSISPVSGTHIVKNFAPRPYYLAATKGNTELISELNDAISELNQIQPGYQNELFEKYFGSINMEFDISDSQREFLKSIGTLHVLCVDNDGPYVFSNDGKAVGMLVSAINNFAEKGGITAEYTFCNNRKEAEEMLGESDYDMVIGMPFSSRYCSSIGYITSEKIMESSFLLAYKPSDTGRTSAAMVEGTEEFVDTSGYQTVKYYDNASECLKAVKRGEADVAIGDRSILEYYTHDASGALNVTLLPGQTQNISIALSDKCDLRLIQLFNNFICSLTTVDITNYLDDGSVHSEALTLSVLVQNYPIQTVILVSIVSTVFAVLLLGSYYIRKMRQKNEELRRANEVKSDFLARMSHDIRTPMNGIIGMLDISERFTDDPEKIRKYHRKIRLASEYLLSLINDVLDMSKLDSGKLQLVKESVYLREIINNCKDILEARAIEMGITLDSSGLESFNPPKVFTSPLHLRQIFMNIIGNAIKYNKTGGKVYVSAKVIRQTDEAVSCEFSVEDTGIGMSEEFQKRAFEPFTQENENTHGELKGTGLGLSIVKRLIDMMNGSIYIKSTPGKGTIFSWNIDFEIDRIFDEESEETTEGHKVDLSGSRILAAEDNALNSEILQFMLRDAGMEVVMVEDGCEAVDTFRKSEPGYFDFILMDIMMPKKNGYEAAREIRKSARPDAKTIPIIALTANAYAEDKKKALDAGMNAHVSKPIDMRVLIRELERVKNQNI